MKKETMLKLYELRNRIDKDSLKLVTEIIIDTFQEGIEYGMKTVRTAKSLKEERYV